VLWIALGVNLAMFFVEFGASLRADSAALLADAIDFAGDAANYGLSLGALALGVRWQSRAALVKGVSMSAYGVGVIMVAGWRLVSGAAPEPMTMGAVGALAFVANVGVALLLYAYRDGNANMRSVWRCTRNDALGNVAVMFAAFGVFGTGSHYPDLAVAFVIASLALVSGTATVREARRELRVPATVPEAVHASPCRMR
jgi:Co/Zn/Cd efflux system component